MTLSVGVSGSHETAGALSVGVGGAWKSASKAWVGVGGAWKVFYNALSVECADVEGFGADFAASGPVTSDGAAPVVTGGSGSETYLWEYVSGSAVPECDAPTSATTTWSNANTPEGANASVWRLTVTDGGATATVEINVTLTWTNQN